MLKLKQWMNRRRAALGAAFSLFASLTGFINPLLAGAAVSRAITALYLPVLAPFIMGMLFVKGARLLLRYAAGRLIRGNPRAPFVYVQHHIGKWLWWIEPLLRRWGPPGVAVQWLRRKKGRLALPVRVASFLTYYLTDTLVTFLAGVIYYISGSYFFSLFPVLLPVAMATPWFARKSARLHRLQAQAIR